MIIVVGQEIYRRYNNKEEGFQESALPSYFDALKQSDCADLLIEEKEFSKFGIKRFSDNQMLELKRVASSKPSNLVPKFKLNANYQVSHNLDYTLEFRNQTFEEEVQTKLLLQLPNVPRHYLSSLKLDREACKSREDRTNNMLSILRKKTLILK